MGKNTFLDSETRMKMIKASVINSAQAIGSKKNRFIGFSEIVAPLFQRGLNSYYPLQVNPVSLDVKYNFDNCSATLAGTGNNTTINRVHIEWIPLIGASSYKLFWRYGQGSYGATSVLGDPIPNDPADDKESSNFTDHLYQFQSAAAITSTSCDIIASSNQKVITFYLYAYSDAAGTSRMTNFPLTILQCLGNGENKMFLSRSSYYNLKIQAYFFTDDDSGYTNNDALKTKPIS